MKKKIVLLIIIFFTTSKVFGQFSIQVIDSIRKTPIPYCILKIDSSMFSSDKDGFVKFEDNYVGKQIHIFKDGYSDVFKKLNIQTTKIFLYPEIKIEEVVLRKMKEIHYAENSKIAKFPFNENIEYAWLQTLENDIKIKKISIPIKIRNKNAEGYLILSICKNEDNKPGEIVDESIKIWNLDEVRNNKIDINYVNPIAIKDKSFFISIKFIDQVGNEFTFKKDNFNNKIFLGMKKCNKYHCELFSRLIIKKDEKWLKLQDNIYQKDFLLTPAVEIDYLK